MDAIAKNKWKKLLALAKSGSSDAQWEVGYYHEYGAVDESGSTLAKVNLEKAHRWYKVSAEQGNQGAQCSLSNLLSTGEGIDRDYEAAIYWAKKAIAQGNASAAFNLGTIYRDQNKPAMALRCYKRAALMGDDDSLLQIGLCYLFGYGTKQDLRKAYGYLNKVTAGDPNSSCQRTKENALYWMAVLTLTGIGDTKRSVMGARKMLESANADDDHEQANEILNVIGKSRYQST